MLDVIATVVCKILLPLTKKLQIQSVHQSSLHYFVHSFIRSKNISHTTVVIISKTRLPAATGIVFGHQFC